MVSGKITENIRGIDLGPVTIGADAISSPGVNGPAAVPGEAVATLVHLVAFLSGPTRKDDALDPWMCAILLKKIHQSLNKWALKSQQNPIKPNKDQPEIGKTPPLFPCKDRTEMVKHSCRSLFGDSHTSYNTQMQYAGACVFCVNLIFSACLAPSLEENQNKKKRSFPCNHGHSRVASQPKFHVPGLVGHTCLVWHVIVHPQISIEAILAIPNSW